MEHGALVHGSANRISELAGSILMRFSLPLPFRLALLVAGTMLPLILFAAAIIYAHYLQDKRQAFDRVEQVMRGIRLVLDREMQGIVSGLTVLANSRSLARDDFDSFQISAAAFLKQFPDHPSIVIGDQAGRILFNSSSPPGAALPSRTLRPERDIVFRTGKPAFSPLFIGSVSRQSIVTVSVPVFRGGKVVYDLSFNPPLQIFQRIIDQQKPSDDWTISIFDQTGVNFARVPNPAQTFGKQASPTLYAVMFSAPEGQAPTVSLEGVPLLAAFSRSEISGWIPAAGIAVSTLTAPALRAFVLAGLVGSLLLMVGLFFAIRMATRIAHGEALHTLLIDELNHRVKNTLATVQSLSAQTFRDRSDGEARDKFAARLASLGSTHDILSEKKWEGAPIRDIIANALAPFQMANAQRIVIDGHQVQLPSRAVVMLSMVLHELATNAAKYGALSNSRGRVLVSWRRKEQPDGDRVELEWRETGGPEVKQPESHGFGSTLIEKGLAAQLGGSSTLRFERGGVACTLEFPLK